jgi:Na+-transporting NADH:ubiquinone oxidoreductase subunit A
MSKVVKLRKGFDIKLQGEAEKVFAKYEQPTTYAIKPADFNGILPKLLVLHCFIIKTMKKCFSQAQ